MKKIFFGVLKIFLGTLLLFVFLEAICFLGGIPRGADRFIECIIIREKLSAHKPKGEVRVFTYGESTMHGAHYAPYSSPARWLSVYLKDFLPDRKIRVINFSRMGHDSSFVYRAARDTLAYRPDVCIFYTGHNELLPGNLVSDVAARQSTFSYKAREWVRSSRLLSLAYRLALRHRAQRKGESFEDTMELKSIERQPTVFVDQANLTYRNTPAYKDNILYFKQMLSDILALGKKTNVPLFFFKPGSNLKDFSPTYSLHIKTLTPEVLSRWNFFYEEGQKAQAKADLKVARNFYEKAYALDDSHAELSFRLGKIYFKDGDLQKARNFFEQARDNDGFVVRATTDILDVFEGLRKTHDLKLIETEKILSAEAPGGILGEPMIEDNVHPSVKAQSLMGRAAAQEIADENWIAPRSEWKFDRERPFEEIVKELGVGPDVLFMADLKMVFYFGSRFENRLRFAKKALELKPHSPPALRHLAWTYWLMGEKDQALEIYRHLYQVDPAAFQTALKNQADIKDSYEKKFNVLLNPRHDL